MMWCTCGVLCASPNLPDPLIMRVKTLNVEHDGAGGLWVGYDGDLVYTYIVRLVELKCLTDASKYVIQCVCALGKHLRKKCKYTKKTHSPIFDVCIVDVAMLILQCQHEWRVSNKFSFL